MLFVHVYSYVSVVSIHGHPICFAFVHFQSLQTKSTFDRSKEPSAFVFQKRKASSCTDQKQHVPFFLFRWLKSYSLPSIVWTHENRTFCHSKLVSASSGIVDVDQRSDSNMFGKIMCMYETCVYICTRKFCIYIYIYIYLLHTQLTYIFRYLHTT